MDKLTCGAIDMYRGCVTADNRLCSGTPSALSYRWQTHLHPMFIISGISQAHENTATMRIKVMFPTLSDLEFLDNMSQLMNSTTEKPSKVLYEERDQLAERISTLRSDLAEATHNVAASRSVIKHLKLGVSENTLHRTQRTFCEDSTDRKTISLTR